MLFISLFIHRSLAPGNKQLVSLWRPRGGTRFPVPDFAHCQNPICVWNETTFHLHVDLWEWCWYTHAHRFTHETSKSVKVTMLLVHTYIYNRLSVRGCGGLEPFPALPKQSLRVFGLWEETRSPEGNPQREHANLSHTHTLAMRHLCASESVSSPPTQTKDCTSQWVFRS